jgi:hypothetical protein
MKSKLALVFLLTMLSSGCALTQTVKQVDYAPKVDKAAVAGLAGHSVRIGSFTDNRAVENPAILFHKRNAYNNTMSGAYLAQKPLVEYVKDGVVASLKDAGTLSDTDGLVLTASLEDFDEEVQMGFWKSKMSTKMTVKFALRDGSRQVWNDTIIGKALIDKGDFVTQAVTLSTDDVVRQLMNNDQFKQAISGSAQ